MRHEERGQEPAAVVAGDATEEGPALRDASATAARADADEREAIAARDRLRDGALPSLEPDDDIADQLGQGELVHALRRSAILRPPGDDRALGYGGTLYLTSRRLVHIGQVTVKVQLGDIVETAMAGERLLVTLSNGEGFSLELDRPRLLRVELGAALRSLRR